MLESLAGSWWVFALAAAAIYILHLYRRARLSQAPPEDPREGFMHSLSAWIRIHSMFAIGIIGSVFGVLIAVTQLGGWSLLALGTLDPIVLVNLGIVALSGLHIAGIEFSSVIWIVTFVVLGVGGYYFGGFWRNRHYD